MERSLNVATPLEAVRLNVPLKVPPAGLVPMDIATDAVPTRLPPASCSCTVTAGLMETPATALLGCCPKTSFAAGPTFTVTSWVPTVLLAHLLFDLLYVPVTCTTPAVVPVNVAVHVELVVPMRVHGLE